MSEAVVKESDIKDFLSRADYRGLKSRLQSAHPRALSRDWEKFKPLEKVVLFKLMETDFALKFYQSLSFAEKYFLLGADGLGPLAPILESLPSIDRALFHSLSKDQYDEMLSLV